ncbi:MAG: response regulator transcription factor [Xanthomonadales bacterium]|nr:Sensory transduction protein LytR [Xanthomonadales bacterium]MCC6593530.1 response regulator transcription factor [Xanthomonadales bacterium]MCE7932847.1 DNA-binding response regulator [Xanthomonadales bacterium PRO6]
MTPRPLRCLLVDDEALARRGLRHRLTQIGGVEIVAEAGNGREALALIGQHEVDLMFLDIQMPGIDGFGVLRTLPVTRWPLVVFTTAYDQYALDAFRVHAVDYLLKPVEDERLREALARARKLKEHSDLEAQHARLLALVGSDQPSSLGERADDRLTLKDGSTLIRVPLADIRWIDAAGDYVVVHTAQANHIARASLRELAERLPPERFVRIHRSTIVHARYVTRLRPHINGEYFVDLDGGHELKLSRGYRDQLDKLA